MRNVIIVVPVLITSCQVSEKWKKTPAAAAIEKAAGLPVAFVTTVEKWSNTLDPFFGFMKEIFMQNSVNERGICDAAVISAIPS